MAKQYGWISLSEYVDREYLRILNKKVLKRKDWLSIRRLCKAYDRHIAPTEMPNPMLDEVPFRNV